MCDPGRVRTAYRCRAYPDEAAAGGAEPHVRLRAGGVEPDPGRPARPLAYRAHGYLLRGDHRALTAMKKDPDLAFLSAYRRFRSSRRSGTSTRRSVRSSPSAPATRGFKCRRGRQSAHYTRSAFSLRRGELRLAKTDAMLRFVWSWPEVDVTALNPTMVIVSREPDGRWYVTFTIDASDPEPLPETGRAVGIDLGVTDFAVTSRRGEDRQPAPSGAQGPQAGTVPAAPGPLPERVGSNRAKAAATVARAHRKVRHARRRLPAPRQHPPGPRGRHHRDRRPQRLRHGPQPASGPRHRRLRLGRVPPPARVQVPAVRPPTWS